MGFIKETLDVFAHLASLFEDISQRGTDAKHTAQLKALEGGQKDDRIFSRFEKRRDRIYTRMDRANSDASQERVEARRLWKPSKGADATAIASAKASLAADFIDINKRESDSISSLELKLEDIDKLEEDASQKLETAKDTTRQELEDRKRGRTRTAIKISGFVLGIPVALIISVLVLALTPITCESAGWGILVGAIGLGVAKLKSWI